MAIFGQKKGENEFFWTWCQYKKCRYWSKLTFYGVWAKSLEPFLIKLPKTLKMAIFDQKKGENEYIYIFFLLLFI